MVCVVSRWDGEMTQVELLLVVAAVVVLPYWESSASWKEGRALSRSKVLQMGGWKSGQQKKEHWMFGKQLQQQQEEDWMAWQ